jgi:hypothetical protein
VFVPASISSPAFPILPSRARRRVALNQRFRAALASIPGPPSGAGPFPVRG